MISVQDLENPTQLRDLDYICELAERALEGEQGTWPQRIARYRQILAERIAKSGPAF